MMENSEKALAQTLAHLLASARYMAAGNALLFLAAVYLNGVLTAIQVLLIVALIYFHFRMEFDGRLFADFSSDRLMPEDFDEYRWMLGLGRSKGAAEMQQRCSGALSLLKKAAFLTILQCVVLLLQICFR